MQWYCHFKTTFLAEEWKCEKRRGIYFPDNEHMVSNEVEAFQTLH